MANAIQRAFGDAGEYLDVLEFWSTDFVKRNTGNGLVTPNEMQWESLWGHPEALQLPAPENDDAELEETLKTVLSELPKRAHEVLKRLFWNGESHQRIGEGIGLSRSRVRSIELNALRLLRQPAWTRKLAIHNPRLSKCSAAAGRPEDGNYGRP